MLGGGFLSCAANGACAIKCKAGVDGSGRFQITALPAGRYYQDEMSLGFEKAYSPTLNFGAKVTYRALRSTLDDYCDAGIITRWNAANPQYDTSKTGGTHLWFVAK